MGASVAGSDLMTLILLASTPFFCSTMGHRAFDEEKVGMATVLPSMSLRFLILLSARVNSASGCLEYSDITALTGILPSAAAIISAEMPPKPTSAEPEATLVTASAEPRPGTIFTSRPSSLKKPCCTPA